MFLLLLSATYYDLRKYRVPNHIILSGLGTSLLIQLFTKGLYGIVWWGKGIIIPVAVLFILYLFHVIGAGDIKLFSVVGGFLGVYQVIHVIILAFIIGAVMSVFQMIRFRNLGNRMQYLANYIHKVIKEKKIKSYYNVEEGSPKDIIPFTLAIMISVFIATLTIKVS